MNRSCGCVCCVSQFIINYVIQHDISPILVVQPTELSICFRHVTWGGGAGGPGPPLPHPKRSSMVSLMGPRLPYSRAGGVVFSLRRLALHPQHPRWRRRRPRARSSRESPVSPRHHPSTTLFPDPAPCTLIELHSLRNGKPKYVPPHRAFENCSLRTTVEYNRDLTLYSVQGLQ